MYRKILISKEGQEQMRVHYEVGDKCIENKEYQHFFDNFSPNFDFSLVDKIIQEYSRDIIPTFKNSIHFTNDDLENIVRPFKNDYVLNRKMKKDPVSYFKTMTRRRKDKQNNNAKMKNKRKNKKRRKNPAKSKSNKTKKVNKKKSGKKSGNKK